MRPPLAILALAASLAVANAANFPSIRVTGDATLYQLVTTTNDAITKLRFSPTTGNPTNGAGWNMVQYVVANMDGSYSEDMNFGYNFAPGGGVVDTNYHGFGWSYESNWQNGPTNHYAEFHTLLNLNGHQYRPTSFGMALNNTNDWHGFFQLNEFQLMYPNTVPWYYMSPERLAWSSSKFTNKTVEFYADESSTPHGFFLRSLTNGVLTTAEELYLNESSGWSTIWLPGGYARPTIWEGPNVTFDTAYFSKKVTGGSVTLENIAGFPHLYLNVTNAGNSTTLMSFEKSGTWMWSMGTDYNNNNTKDFWLLDRGTSHLALFIAPTTRRVEINGTGNPGAQLDVVGDIRASTSISGGSLTVTTNATAKAFIVSGTTNQVIFGATNTAPVSSAAPTKWISVQVSGESAVYRIPLYE